MKEIINEINKEITTNKGTHEILEDIIKLSKEKIDLEEFEIFTKAKNYLKSDNEQIDLSHTKLVEKLCNLKPFKKMTKNFIFPLCTDNNCLEQLKYHPIKT